MAISVVPIKIIGRGIVCDEQIRSSIVVEVAPDHAQAVVSRAVHAPGFGNVGERAVTVVMIQAVAQALHPARPALHRNSPEAAIASEAELGKVLQVESDVPANPNVHQPTSTATAQISPLFP